MKWIKDNNKDYQWVSTFPTDSPFFKNKILKDFFNEIHPKKVNYFLSNLIIPGIIYLGYGL